MTNIMDRMMKMEAAVGTNEQRISNLQASWLSEAKEVSETLSDLQNRVKSQNNKLNQFIQNVVALKKLPQTVEELKKRLEVIEN